jgi:hypothetical protein
MQQYFQPDDISNIAIDKKYMKPKIKFVQRKDGVRLAYSSFGQEPEKMRLQCASNK